MRELDDAYIQAYQEALLNWFATSGRQFPWRLSKNPYHVLVLEKLLQQTSVKESILGIYSTFLEMYPTIQALSSAEPEKIRILIQPLGLHYRAGEMVVMAKEIQNRFDGEIPADLNSLLSIHGIGGYSARAVLCFAYGIDVPVVDTNIARILYRTLGISGKMPANPARKRALIDIMEKLISPGNCRPFNWGMIDLGGLICTSTNPKCPDCPLNSLCEYNLKLVEDGDLTNT
jgi:A/G-specific adenine glycosylase